MDLRQESEFMTDLWNFRKQFYRTDDWQGVYDESKRISDKYNSSYVDYILAVCIGDIEERAGYKGNNFNRMMAMLKDRYEHKD